jgi:hypothetical protein
MQRLPLDPDTPAFRERVERLQDQIGGLREGQAARRPLVQARRVRGVPRIDAATGNALYAAQSARSSFPAVGAGGASGRGALARRRTPEIHAPSAIAMRTSSENSYFG